ncbi:CSLREA domain-containing protein [Tahibacter amnicola]|uniref:CSLREA domain-containing protein n=1 Tax=Tahibacter amnicola TaxID=2976241 RepID=A0ABY6B979_9GAMM|nr:CSLREA domain-containing protein [Tahibacter amnicola]UXI66559.1 CSLREA domain-containing protein [Tahibacter amnicola]
MHRCHWFQTAILAAALVSTGVGAATITVSVVDDVVANDGACSLREAITAANTGQPSGMAPGECGRGLAAPYTRIDVPSGTYRITRVAVNEDNNAGGDLDLRAAFIELRGDDAQTTTLRGDRDERVLDIGDANATTVSVIMSGLTLRDGGGATGGGIRVRAGASVQLSQSMLSNNEASTGGAIYAEGALSIDRVTFHANAATDPAGPGGGAIRYVGATTATLRNATFNGNESFTDGGFARFDGPAMLNNVTVTETVTDADFNGSGDGALVSALSVQMSNSILAGNADLSVVTGGANNPDCVAAPGTLVSAGYNLIGNIGTACNVSPSTGDLFGSAANILNPQLMPLALYLGDIDTQPPMVTSPAFDTGDPALPSGAPHCEPVDAHGLPRRSGGRCDRGATEAYERIFADGFDM